METVYEISSIQIKKGELQAEGLYMLYHPMSELCSVWFDKIEADVLMTLTDNEFIEAACEMLELDEDVIHGGWQLTDGSAESLQLGRKINDTTWQYRQWCDGFDFQEGKYIKVTKSVKFKNWESSKWVEDIIDLRNYNVSDIHNAIISHGYLIGTWDAELQHFYIKSYDRETSIQLAIECIFESEN